LDLKSDTDHTHSGFSPTVHNHGTDEIIVIMTAPPPDPDEGDEEEDPPLPPAVYLNAYLEGMMTTITFCKNWIDNFQHESDDWSGWLWDMISSGITAAALAALQTQIGTLQSQVAALWGFNAGQDGFQQFLEGFDGGSSGRTMWQNMQRQAKRVSERITRNRSGHIRIRDQATRGNSMLSDGGITNDGWSQFGDLISI
jgi:hypothetical protein